MSDLSRRVPPLDSWILEYLSAEWPGFKELRSAASALGQRDRLRNAISILVNDVQVAMAGACPDCGAAAVARSSRSAYGGGLGQDRCGRGAGAPHAQLRAHAVNGRPSPAGHSLAFLGGASGLSTRAVLKGGRLSHSGRFSNAASAPSTGFRASTGATSFRARGSLVLGGSWTGHGL